MTFSFYVARPLRRQKYSSLRTAENSCKLHPLRRKNAPPSPTRRGSTAAKAVFASPLRTKKVKAASALAFSFYYKARPLRRQKYSPLRTAENSCRLNPLRRKNAPPTHSARLDRCKSCFCKPASHKKVKAESALTFSFYIARPLRRKNAPPPPLGAARQAQKLFSQARFGGRNILRFARRKTRAGLTPLRRKNAPPPTHSARLDRCKSCFCKPASHKKSQGGKP